MKKIERLRILSFVAGLLILSSCGDDDGASITIDEPTTYAFERDGSSTVSFSGQTDRIMMAEEIIDGLKDTQFTEAQLDAMYDHQEGNADFSDTDLNTSTKSVRSKTAASTDFFSSNATDASAIKGEFDAWIAEQVSEVFPNWGADAVAGTAGGIQEAGGGSTRYVNANGLELNQAFNKGLIGALMVDQILNNYVGTAVLDAGDNRANNDAGTVEDGKSYTTMEHKWDEAYGYAYGTATDTADPNPTIGGDDSFLNKYIGRVEGDADFAGIADDIYNAFKRGRAAIVAGAYEERDAQAAIIREKVSTVIAVRAVYYLQQGKAGLEAASPDMASVFHDLSEGYGFIYSLQFTRNPNTDASYFSRSEVQGFISDLMGDGNNGLWDLTTATLDAISESIAAQFDFTVAQARS